MNKKEFTTRVKEIRINENTAEAKKMFEQLVEELHESKESNRIIELYNNKKFTKYCRDSFYIAYYLKSEDHIDNSKNIYENILVKEPNNTAVLNNLAVIYREKKDFDKSFDLIKRAYEINNDDEVITSNFNQISNILEKIKSKTTDFQNAVSKLSGENQFVLRKLKIFIENFKIQQEYSSLNNTLPIPQWKFRELMKTDEIKADSLRDQWLDKIYIYDTGDRGKFNEKVYELNPFLDKELLNLNSFQIKKSWIENIEKLNRDTLINLSYFKTRTKISKINRKYKYIILRDFDELILNYLFQNYKSVVILSGSIVEEIMLYYLDKKKISKIEYSIGKKQISKNLYDSSLIDLLNYLEESNELTSQIINLGNVTRIYRNYIHAGKEIKEGSVLNKNKVDICLNSVLELIGELIR